MTEINPPLQAYRRYIGMKLLFEGKYPNARKYGFKSAATAKSFDRRRDRYYFEKMSQQIANKDQPVYFAAQFLDGETWIGNMFGDEANNRYLKLSGEIDRSDYLFKRDMKACLESESFIHSFVQGANSQYPSIINLLVNEEISYVSAGHLYNITKFLDVMTAADQVFLPNIKDKIMAMAEVLETPIKEYQQTFVEILEDAEYK